MSIILLETVATLGQFVFMPTELKLSGGCLCGTIRYCTNTMPFDADYCHCRQCQLSSGAIVVCWMDFKADQIHWLANKPTEYSSSAKIQRGFCPTCGGSISYRHADYPDYLTLTIASLDNPNLVAPKYHIYTDNQPNWFIISDNCLRYPNKRT